MFSVHFEKQKDKFLMCCPKGNSYLVINIVLSRYKALRFVFWEEKKRKKRKKERRNLMKNQIKQYQLNKKEAKYILSNGDTFFPQI